MDVTGLKVPSMACAWYFSLVPNHYILQFALINYTIYDTVHYTLYVCSYACSVIHAVFVCFHTCASHMCSHMCVLMCPHISALKARSYVLVAV